MRGHRLCLCLVGTVVKDMKCYKRCCYKRMIAIATG